MSSVLVESAINSLAYEILEVVSHLQRRVDSKALDWIAVAVARALLHDELPLLGKRNDVELLHYKRFIQIYSKNM